mmetsp:Transcript_141357/g.249507  ORF Transcript_141357/g.249507 Transcript_141357/m.249507 type:complete len:81 (-) Transcript_141357:66-308(-)
MMLRSAAKVNFSFGFFVHLNSDMDTEAMAAEKVNMIEPYTLKSRLTSIGADICDERLESNRIEPRRYCVLRTSNTIHEKP